MMSSDRASVTTARNSIIGTTDRLGYFNCNGCGLSSRGGSRDFTAEAMSAEGERCDACGAHFLPAYV